MISICNPAVPPFDTTAFLPIPLTHSWQPIKGIRARWRSHGDIVLLVRCYAAPHLVQQDSIAEALIHMVFCFASVILHSGFQFAATQQQRSLCIWNRFLVRSCNFGHHLSLGSTPSLSI
ncbi:predicted protein [Lichtheimia corymbifera JMRC:FSU:9682]|uniref:Uncharacterized protein n=1 Tax=Lichtheimia corymbifera JMRC:FSU:9682 TaxID=1263082 RepID=A0A068S684_9FUNG|nr:predicted protein [Lichtheimia corymbifera JMRC:FSU:9682]